MSEALRLALVTDRAACSAARVQLFATLNAIPPDPENLIATAARAAIQQQIDAISTEINGLTAELALLPPLAAPTTAATGGGAGAVAAAAPAPPSGPCSTVVFRSRLQARHHRLRFIRDLPPRAHDELNTTHFFCVTYDGEDCMLKCPTGVWLTHETAGITRINDKFSRAEQVANNIMVVDVLDAIPPRVPGAGESVGFLSQMYDGSADQLELSPELKVQILRAIETALRALHLRSIIHGDVKPENVFIRRTADGCDVVLGDFGAVVPFETEIRVFSPGFTIAEWREDLAHPKMDWAALVLSGLHLLGRAPAHAFDADARCVHFAGMPTAVEALGGVTGDDAAVATEIQRIFNEFVRNA